MSNNQSKYHKYLQSEEWKSLKIDLIQKRGCYCQICKKKKHPAAVQIHHLTYENIFNELPEDLIIVCRKCHMKEHGLIKPKQKRPKRSPKKYAGLSKRDKALQKRYDAHRI